MTTEQLTTEITAATTIRRVLVIHNQDEYNAAGAELKEIRTKKTRVIAFFADSKQKAHAAWKAVCETEKKLTSACDAVIDLITAAMKHHDLELDAQRRKAQAALNAIAEAEAAADRKRMETNAKRAATRGATDQAAIWQAKAQAVTVIPAAAPVLTQSAPGISTRWPWRAEVVDMKAFLHQVADNPTLHVFIGVDTNNLARIFGGEHGIIAPQGLRFWQEPTYTRK